MCFCHLNNCVDYCTGIRSIHGTVEQPHERLCLDPPPFLIQYLDPCLIRHCKLTFQQLPVEVIIHWLQIFLGTINDPVRKGGTNDLCPILFPVFLLQVNREPVAILLIHSPCNRGCRCGAFPNQACRNLGLDDHRLLRIPKSFFTGWASITLPVVFDHFTGGMDEFQFPADILLTDQKHLCAAYRTAPVFF